AHLRDGQRGGVRGQDGVARGYGVELAEYGLLDLHALRYRLHHEVHVAEGVVGGGPGDAAADLLELAVRVLLRDLLLLHEAAELATGDLAGLLEALVHEALLDVLEHHRQAGRRDGLGDLAAHRAGAHHGGLEYVHLTSETGTRRLQGRLLRRRRLQGRLLRRLGGEAAERAGERVREGAADEERVGDPAERAPPPDARGVQLVLEGERGERAAALRVRVELRGLHAGERLLRDARRDERLSAPEHALAHPATASRRGGPDELRPLGRPGCVLLDHVAEALHERGPAGGIRPERERRPRLERHVAACADGLRHQP